MKNYNELPGIISELHLENYESFDSYREGVKAAETFFADNGIEGDVSVNKIKEIKTYDEDRNVTVTTHIYECYVDSGSVDYYHFSYEDEF